MRAVATVAALAAALTPALAASKGKIGFALGTKNADGSCKSQSDYEADFDAIKTQSGSTIVRGYAASDCNNAANILPAAKNKGFQVILGVWPDVQTSFDADTGALKKYVPQYKDQVYAVTVGSEALYRGNFTGPQLLEKINAVKAMLPGTKIGTADSWGKWNDGTADAIIQGGIDIALVNAFAYWQGKSIDDGSAIFTYLDDIAQAMAHIQALSGSLDKIEIWNGETGWPTDGGSDYGDAKAGTDNAAKFHNQAFCGLIDWGVNAFYFEAFDEPWKPASIGQNGLAASEVHWGAMNADRSVKPNFDLKC